MSSKEIIIVGGGVIGCATAYYLAKQGFRSQIIERDSVGSQASGRAWATVSELMTMDVLQGIGMPPGSVQERVAPPFRPFIKETVDRLPAFADQLKQEAGIDPQYSDLPALYLTFLEEDAAFCQSRVAELQAEGVEIDWVGRGDIYAVYPDLHPTVCGGVTFPGSQIEPYRYTVALAQAAENMGVNIRQGDVVGYETEGSKVTAVRLKSGTVIEGDVFVLANGVRLGEATASLAKTMIVRPFKLEWIRLKLSEQLPNYRLGAAEVTFIPKPDGTTIVGCGPLSGNMGVPRDDGSVKPGVPLDYDWQDKHNDLPTDEILERFTEAAVTVLPRVETADMTEHTAGLLAWLPGDSLGTMGSLPEFDNTYVATTEIGIMLSLSMGRLLSELVLNGKTEEDIGIFSPEKYLK